MLCDVNFNHEKFFVKYLKKYITIDIHYGYFLHTFYQLRRKLQKKNQFKALAGPQIQMNFFVINLWTFWDFC